MAISADDTYLAICKPGPGVYPLGYVPHNHHFLWFAATMEGSSEIARAAAAHTGERTSDPQLMRTPGFEAMQNFSLTPLYAAVRFGHWDDVTAMPKPADDVPVHAGDVELRPGDGGREPGPLGRREEVPRGARAGDERARSSRRCWPGTAIR